MTVISHPAVGHSKKAWNKVRAPLHQLISYSELVAEEVSGGGELDVEHPIARILVICEALLRHTEADLLSSDPEGASAGAAPSDSVLRFHAELRTLTHQLLELPDAHMPASIRSDVHIIGKTVDSLETAFLSLAQGSNQAPNHESPSPVKVGVKSKPAAPSAPDRQLIATQVEYLGLLLVVDDDEGNRDVLSRRLLRDGYEVMLAEGGRQALRMLKRYNFDLVLLDIMMPEMDGMSVLAELKQDPQLRQLPVIMITAVDDIESIVHCIQAGADDYLLKPFNPILLRARISALLDRKRLQDEQQRQHRELEAVLDDSRRQAERAEKLLLNILPSVVAEELREHGMVEPMYFEDVTIVFADIVGFTVSTEQLPADELVEHLHRYFTACDHIVSRYGLEKLKTIGDCYMFAGGLPTRTPSHPVDSVLAASEMINAMADVVRDGQVDWKLRIGINTGPVIAGVVGIHKFAFDVWGDAVNFASRVEACGAPGRINLSQSTFGRVKDFFACERRQHVRIKEGKEVEMFFLNGIAGSLLKNPSVSSLAAFRKRYAAFFRKELAAYPKFLFEPDVPTTTQSTN